MDEPSPGWQIRYCLLVLVEVFGAVGLMAFYAYLIVASL